MTRYAQRTLIQQPSIANWGKAASGIGVKDGYGVATGGTSSPITVSTVNYTMLTFSASATLTVTTAGLFDVLMVGGGGAGGGNGGSGGGSGGGAGGLVTATIYLDATTYSVAVGALAVWAGGASGIAGSSSIGSTTIGALVAPVALGGNGYSGGATDTGALRNWGLYPSGTSANTTTVSSQTNNGGAGSGTNGAGGGGGAGGAGTAGVGSAGGAGGAGFDASAWRGEVALTTRYAAGGGGGATTTGGAGGAGGGGAGSSSGVGSASTTAGSGGGGSNSGGATAGGNGSNGIVLIRFKI